MAEGRGGYGRNIGRQYRDDYQCRGSGWKGRDYHRTQSSRGARGRGDYFYSDEYIGSFNQGTQSGYGRRAEYYDNRYQGHHGHPDDSVRVFSQRGQGGCGRRANNFKKRFQDCNNERNSYKETVSVKQATYPGSSNWYGYPDDQGWGGYPRDYSWERRSLNTPVVDCTKPTYHPPSENQNDRGEWTNSDNSIEKEQAKQDKRNVIEVKETDSREAQMCMPKETPTNDKKTTSNARDSVHNTSEEETMTNALQALDIEGSATNQVKVTEPGMITMLDSSSSSIILAWNLQKDNMNNITNYEIKYRKCHKGSKWNTVVTNDSIEKYIVEGLQSGTEYEFKIRALNEDGDEGSFTRPNVKMSTKISLANLLKENCLKIKTDHPPEILKLPTKEIQRATNCTAKIRKCEFGTRKADCVLEKTILMIGATGSGKSTLIDAMINYITDVSWDDDYRFSIIDLTDDERDKQGKQDQSQTEWITCYTIHHTTGSRINYDLHIIDTPGFGDTRGILRDKAIVDQIREMLTSPEEFGIMLLDIVCFVIQAPLARLTPPQRYIFDSILSIFGQNIASNINVLITFADGKEPPVIAALKAGNVPFQKTFKFNNSALFSNKDKEENSFGKLFWNLGQENLRVFFDDLRTVESKSLQLTAEVLQTREHLETVIQGLQPQIFEGMNKLNNIRQETEVLKKHKNDIDNNKNFTYVVNEIRMREESLPYGKYVTNCLICNRTCHYPCNVYDDEKKRKCSVIDRRSGDCKVCPGECYWDKHKNNSFRFVTYSVDVTKTYEELKSKYEIAQQQEKQQRSVLDEVKYAFKAHQEKVYQMIHKVRCFLNKLNEIALRPNPLTDVDYIDLLIETEKQEHKCGWKDRVKLLNKVRQQAELVAKSSDANFKPFGEEEKILREEI